ncbi:oligopeptidase A [Deltaproteobacteria bacterium TL4]
MNNPLLEMKDLPPFEQILPQHMEEAITTGINSNLQEIESLLKQSVPYTWDNLVLPLETLDNRLNRIWSPIGHLNAVMNSDEMRQAYNACLTKISEYSTFMGQHYELYQAFKSIADGAEYHKLTAPQQKIIENTLRDFKRSGVALPEEQKLRYKDIKKRVTELSSKFSENVLDATMAWTKHILDPKELKGLPETALETAKETARQKGLEGYLLTLEPPCFTVVITYADDRKLRQEIYKAYITRASDQGPHAGQWDNTKIMEELLQLRHELAQLLGHANYAEHSLVTKMAENPDQVICFLKDLVERSKAAGLREYQELQNYAKKHYQQESLAAWDLSYYSEKLKQHQYSISQEELRPFFPEDTVLAGMFEVVKRLFGVHVQEKKTVPVWHENVRFFELFDEAGILRGSFYLDLYARPHKRGGAWMDECRVRFLNAQGQLQTPVAYLVCNLNKPVGGKPALFTHQETLVLFHEFGHGLHHLLTLMDYPSIAGINGVAWDAVELPSQFLENWVWQKEALDFISGHYKTGAALSTEVLNQLLNAKNFQSGLQMLRQLEFSLFDFLLHQNFQPERGARIQEVLNEVRDAVSVVKSPEFNRFQHGFTHIFAGGYAAGYYGYKWAEVLSSDAFSRFEKEGIFNRQTGLDFLHTILEQGGSKNAIELFEAFRGRPQSIEALLKHCGIES